MIAHALSFDFSCCVLVVIVFFVDTAGFGRGVSVHWCAAVCGRGAGCWPWVAFLLVTVLP